MSLAPETSRTPTQLRPPARYSKPWCSHAACGKGPALRFSAQVRISVRASSAASPPPWSPSVPAMRSISRSVTRRVCRSGLVFNVSTNGE
jgi:hypothetical protein